MRLRRLVPKLATLIGPTIGSESRNFGRFAVAAAILMFGTLARAQTEKVLYNFTGGNDGNNPAPAALLHHNGALYGATQEHLFSQNGTIFQLTPNGTGGWNEATLYSFRAGADGATPQGSLAFDKAGNLYGTTFDGGRGSCQFSAGCGTAFELTPSFNGEWTESVIYTFSGNNGSLPEGGIISDGAGTLYGTSVGVYPSPGGVFELKRSPSGDWKRNILHKFTGADGSQPTAALTFYHGAFFGTTDNGGIYGYGTVFKLARSSGSWIETVLYNFAGGLDGANPDTAVLFDANGNLFGTTGSGGAQDLGTVFELTPSNGVWTKTVLHDFVQGCDGAVPNALLIDKSGNLYGTTSFGVNDCFYGGVFKLVPSNGEWAYTVLYAFTGGADGSRPAGALVIDSIGNLFGTTHFGGSASSCSIGEGCGVVFEITP